MVTGTRIKSNYQVDCDDGEWFKIIAKEKELTILKNTLKNGGINFVDRPKNDASTRLSIMISLKDEVNLISVLRSASYKGAVLGQAINSAASFYSAEGPYATLIQDIEKKSLVASKVQAPANLIR